MGLKLSLNKEYSETIKKQPLLTVNLDKLVQDLSIFVKKVSIINENITINVNRKHLLIQL
jgi:glycyl-tRNA synthetase beta subunit